MGKGEEIGKSWYAVRKEKSNVLLAHDSRSSARVPRRAWPTLRSR